jgi:four helix bundle protein
LNARLFGRNVIMYYDLLNRNKNINRGFRKLTMWNDAISLYSLVHKMLKDKNEIAFKIKNQIEDSAISISSNIAEGYSRRTIKETLRYYEIALGSSAENYSQFFALLAANQIKPEIFENVDNLLYKIENQIIQMNKNLIERIGSDSDWNTDYKSNNK